MRPGEGRTLGWGRDPQESWVWPREFKILQKICPDWLKRKWPSVFRVLWPESWRSLAPPLHIAAALLALIIYSMTHVLYGFMCQIFITQYRCPYMVPLTFAQVVVSLLLLQALHASGRVTLLPCSLRLAERLLVPSICGAIQSVLALWAEVNASYGLYPLLMSLLPMLCVGWTHVLGLALPPSKPTTFLLSVITLISLTITGMKGVLMPESLGFLYAPLSLLLQSVSLSWLAKVAEDEGGGAQELASLLDICFSLTVNKSLVLGFLCLLHPDGSRLLTEGSWHSALFLGYLLGLLLLGALQHLLLAMAALHVSPLAAALLTSAYALAMPFSNLL
ncbi:hypothetical protein SKAU_G00166690 [Synaphobranchus kaupii]|uniref:Uncharacterized protein n=1 Tax=Synaphobranchus kaupii TaxID=118154 RepID=A0A9Q1FK15_SYNKA|nr:hypothetical protein SKAU_G00166690 [Synaphobranchus kaupii]